MPTVGRNIIALALSRITSGVILFVVQARLADYLGPHDFGRYSLVIAFYVVLFLFVDLGISRFVIKKVSENRDLAHTYYGNFLIAQLVLTAFIFSLFVLIPRLAGYDAGVSQAMLYAGVGLFFASLSIPGLTILHAWQKIHWFAAVIFVESLAKAAWFMLTIWRGEGVVYIFHIYIYVGLFDIVVYHILARRLFKPRFVFHRQTMQKMFFYGLPFAMISGFEMLIAKIDTVILKVFLPYSEVGLYSAAYRFLDFLTFLPAIISLSLFPFFSAKQDLRDKESLEVTDRLNRYLISLTLPLGIGVTMFADRLLLPLFGEAYQGAVLPFKVLIWSTVITLIYAVPNVVMQVKMTRRAVIILIGVTVFNILSNLALVPRYGIMASAWLTVLSYILVAIAYIYYSSRLTEFRIWRFALWPVLATIVMGSVLWQVRDINIFAIVGLGVIIYFGALFAVGFLKKEDLKFFFHPTQNGTH